MSLNADCLPATCNLYLIVVFTMCPQQLELITPFQLYFNPDLILRNYQVSVKISVSLKNIVPCLF